MQQKKTKNQYSAPAKANYAPRWFGACFLVALCVCAWFYTGFFKQDIYGFFRLGTVFEKPAGVPQNAYVFDSQTGYDGQMFLAIALDPLIKKTDTLKALDNPRYRYRRILYPALAHFLAFKNPKAIPWVMVFLNILAFAFCGAGFARLLKDSQQPAWTTALLCFVPGLWMSLSLCTADLIACCLLLWATTLADDKPKLSTFCLALACLTHETIAAVVLLLALRAALKKQPARCFQYLLALLPAATWNVWVVAHIPQQGSTSGVFENFGLPLSGVLHKLKIQATAPLALKNLFESLNFFLLCAAFCAFATKTESKTEKMNITRTAAIVYALLFVFSKTQILGYYLDYQRVFTNAYILLGATTIQAGRTRIKLLILALAAVVGITYAVAYGMGLI